MIFNHSEMPSSFVITLYRSYKALSICIGNFFDQPDDPKNKSNRKDLIGLQGWFSYLTVVQTLQRLHYALLGFLCLQKQKKLQLR